MAINSNYICVYDLETTGINPEVVFPVEIAAVMVHPRKLEIVPNSGFHSFCRPPDYDSMTQELWEFHAKANKKTVDEMKEIIGKASPLEDVFRNFATYIASYHADGTKRKSKFSAPILAGHNTDKYDNVIFYRLCKLYGYCDKNGEQNLVHPRDTIDLLRICSLFFSNQPEPAKYNFDLLREYFGMNASGAHTALTDVEQISQVITRFLRYFWDVAAKTNFKGAFAR